MNLTFPRGRSGLGLLILRGTLATAVLMVETTHFASNCLELLSLAVIGLALLIGFGLFTSIASAISAVLIIATMLFCRTELNFRGTMAMLCLAVALMGGGAYSVDGLIHGWRRIVLPKSL